MFSLSSCLEGILDILLLSMTQSSGNTTDHLSLAIKALYHYALPKTCSMRVLYEAVSSLFEYRIYTSTLKWWEERVNKNEKLNKTSIVQVVTCPQAVAGILSSTAMKGFKQFLHNYFARTNFLEYL